MHLLDFPQDQVPHHQGLSTRAAPGKDRRRSLQVLERHAVSWERGLTDLSPRLAWLVERGG